MHMGCTPAQVVVSFYDQARDSRLQMRLTVNCSDLIADSLPLFLSPLLLLLLYILRLPFVAGSRHSAW